MGQTTLSTFRSNLQRILGNLGHSDTDLDNWINIGYMDMAGAIEFRELQELASKPTAVGDDELILPGGILGIKVVQIVGERKLTHMPIEKWMGHDDTVDNALPESWTTVGSSMKLWPPPDDVYTVRVLYLEEPEKLEDDTDTTVLPSTWDRMLELLASHHAFMDKGENARAQYWLGRAVSYARSRVQRPDVEDDAEAYRGLDVATSEADLRDLGV